MKSYTKTQELKMVESANGCELSRQIINAEHPALITNLETMDRSWMTENERYLLELFLFSYYTAGATIEMMGDFKYSEIKNDWFPDKSDKNKTGRPILNGGLQIMKLYMDRCYGDYILPIYTHKHLTSSQQKERARLPKNLHILSR